MDPASGATYPGVKWTSSDPDIAVVSQDGTVTAKSLGTATKTAAITVTTESGGKTASCAVTVSPVPVSGVTLNLSTLNIAPDKSATLTAVVSPADATNKAVTWTSSNQGVATVSNGTVKGVAVGTATITVKTVDGGHTATCAVTVTSTQVTGVTLDKSAITLGKNGQETLTATVLPDNATNKNVQWTSSNNAVATVAGNGSLTATVTGKLGGSATITVSTVDGGFTAYCIVTVNVPVESVSLDHTNIMLRGSSGSITSKASKAQLSATVLPTDATNKQVTWTSDKPNIATVDPTGMVTGKSAGTATITVTTNDQGKTDTCTVTVHGHFVVTNASEWTDALSNISSAEDGSAGSTKVFVIEIAGSFSVQGIYGSSITGNYKEVRLIGSETISLSSNGRLIQMAANQTFIIDGPTLQGGSGGNMALVYITGGSAVELRNGYIKGNSAPGAYGGGVQVNSGNFTMTGGVIYGSEAAAPLKNTANGGAAVHNSSGPDEENTIYSYPPNP